MSGVNKIVVRYETMMCLFKAKIQQEFGTQKEAAKHFKVSDQFMSAVIKGKKLPTVSMLGYIRAKKILRYEVEQ